MPDFETRNRAGIDQHVVGRLSQAQDGTAQITTGTPTAVNDAVYELTVDIPELSGISAMTRVFVFTADASATATEICDGFRAAMALDTAFVNRWVQGITQNDGDTSGLLRRKYDQA